MKLLRRYASSIAIPLAMLIVATSMPIGFSQARLLNTDELIAGEAAQSERQRVMSFMQRQDVREQIRAMGVNPDEATARVMNLSDREISRIADRLDRSEAGSGPVIGAVVGAVVVIFLVLLVTDLLCLTSVFPFTRCAADARQ